MKVGNINYDDTIFIEGHSFQLNGAGKRKALLFDLYSVALYSNETFTSTQDAIDRDCNKLIRKHLLAGMITGGMLGQIFRDSLQKTHYGKFPEIQNDVNDIVDLFKSIKVKRLDQFDFLYTPENGLAAYQNNKKIIERNNPTLAKAFLEMYLGKHHGDQSLPRRIAGLY